MLQSQIVLALTFIVVVTIIMLSINLSTAMMIISILASFFAMYLNIYAHNKSCGPQQREDHTSIGP
jgi:ABC-type nitrate/sulfonate/bicarbonate transport system permease component